MASSQSNIFIPRDTIKVAAESVGVDVPDDLLKTLAQEAEIKVRDIIAEAAKFMKHSKRDKMTTEDINNALRVRNIDSAFGYGMREEIVFKKAPGASDIYFIEDKELSLEDVVKNTQLPPLPILPSYTVHWLAVSGVQPKIAQNPAATVYSNSKESTSKTDSLILEDPEVKPSTRHTLTKELQEFYEKLTNAICSGEHAAYQAALSSISSDPGLHQLLPYFCTFITKQVAENLQNLQLLIRMLSMVHGILFNPNIHVENYLHQLIPVILTCLVGKRLCESPTENHWALRDHAADLIAYICFNWGKSYATIQPRITKTLLHALLDVKKPLTTHYGAILGLSSLGASTRKIILLPNLERYFKYLIPALEPSDNPVKRLEATMVYQALLSASGTFLFDSSKSFAEGEKHLLDSFANGTFKPNKLLKAADGRAVKAASSTSHQNASPSSRESSPFNNPSMVLDHTLKSVELSGLAPLSTHYSQLYNLFGESLFPYITRRSDDIASTIFL